MTSSYFQNPGEVARKLRESSVDTDEMREYLFQRARDAGLLDERLEDEARNNASWDDDDDTYEPDIEDLRNSADISDYGDDIPFSRNVEIDPDYETYNAFRLAGENPKVRQAIESGESFALGDLDTNREALYQAFQSGRLSPEDLAVLRDAGRSRALDDSGYGLRERDAVNNIIQGVTGSDVDYMPAIEAVGDVIGDIDDVVEPVARATSNRRNLINQLASTRVSDPLGEDVRGGRQLGLPLNRLANVEQALSRAEELPATYAELRNEIADLTQLVGSTRSFSAIPPSTSSDSSVLPQVRALFPNQFELREAVARDRRAQAAAQEERNSLYNVQRRLSNEALELQREVGLTERALNRSPVDINLEGIEIPGLRQQLRDTIEQAQEEETNRGIAQFQEFIEKYPEVGPYLQTPVKLETKKPERDLSKLERFTDTTQQISKPEDRAELYKTMQSEMGIPIEGIAQLEKKYVSGEPSQQKEVIDYIARLGYGDALSNISQSAVSKRAPLVGGGGYTVDDENKALKGYIDKRQADYQKLMNSLPFSTRRAMESRRPSSMTPTPSEMRFGYDPETEEAYRDPQGEYGISLRTGSAPSSFNLADTEFEFRGSGTSKNVLRYLAENPVTNIRSVAFETAAPGWRGYSYAPKEIPAPVFKEMEKFIKNNVMQNMTPGTLIYNSPLDTSDIIESLESRGKTAEDSSMLRRSETFAGRQPNRRAGAYRSVGFGPLTEGSQYAYVNAEGNIVPLQPTPPTSTLRGNLRIEPTRTTDAKTTPGSLNVTQSREPLTSKAYYSADPVTAVPQGVQEYLRAVRRTPAALLPGAADLIPSPEAIQTGYREGALPMVKQMGQEFVQSLPQAVAASSVLAAVPPLAPGVGLGMVGTAGVRALNEVVRQETGEGIVPKLRQVIGTAPRTGAASPVRTTPFVTPQVRPLSSAQRAEMQRRQNRNEIQRRVDLVKERFNPRKGEFGLTEILFGR